MKLGVLLNVFIYFMVPIVSSDSNSCEKFLKKDIPRSVRSCGYSEIVAYCCSDNNLRVLKDYFNEYERLCVTQPEHRALISNLTANIDKLSVECSKQPNLPDDFVDDTKDKKSSTNKKDNISFYMYLPGLVFLIGML